MPRCGRSQLRKSDQNPSIVFTCTSQKPSPSSSRANSLSMIDTLMTIAPGLQAGINAVRVRIHTCARYDGIFNERLDRLLLHIGQEIDHHLTTPLHHPKDWGSVLRQCAPTRFAFEATSTPLSALLLHHFRLTLVAGNHIGFIAFNFV